MKFISILLGEGRKEDLKKKYANKFDEKTLDWFLNIADLQDFNHKYTDFVMKGVHPDHIEGDAEIGINLIKSFDKYQSQLDKKDINQYESFEELDSALFPIKQKQKEKELEKQIDKIYEDDKFVVIIPKNEESSCKYGSGTKWCTTSKGAGHFGRYTSGGQLLFYIIDKKSSKPGNYTKVAVHFDNSGKESWWDTADNRMSDREVEVFKYAFSDITDAIYEHKKKSTESQKNELLFQVFNDYQRLDQTKNYLIPGTKLGIGIDAFENVEGMPNHAVGELTIYLSKLNESKVLDSYQIMISYGDVGFNPRFQRNVFKIDLGFQGNDPSEDSDYMDLGLENFELKSPMVLDTVEKTADTMRRWILSSVMNKVENNRELQKKVTGGQAVFTPTYGYTFGKNKGMISKLVKFLEAGKIGTKLDFLVDIGYIEKITDNGKTKYKRGNYTMEPRELRGQHSSFFAAAKNAGILGYRKVGKDYFLTKGPNFELFKEGKLKAL